MGRAARANQPKTLTEHAENEALPRALRFFLAHPRIACVCIVFWFPIKLTADTLRATWTGARQSCADFANAITVFVSLARGKDVL
jgi:hypothetical protein